MAIDESVELAKRYSDEDGFRFINGVLRRLSDRRNESTLEVNAQVGEAETVAVIETTAAVEESQPEETMAKEEILPVATEEESSAKEQPRKVLPIIRQTSPKND